MPEKATAKYRMKRKQLTREILERIFRLIRPYVPRVLFATIFSLAVSGLNGAIAWLVKPAMDRIFIEQQYQYIYLLPIVIISLYIARAGCGFIQAYLMRTAGMKLVRDTRNRFFHRLLHLPMTAMASSTSGDMLSRLMNDVGALSDILSQTFRTFLIQIPTVIVLLGVAVYRRWDLSLLSFILLPFIAYGTRALSAMVRRRRKRVQEYLAVLSHRVNEAIQGIKVIKIFNMEDLKTKQFLHENKNTYRQMARVIRLREGTKFLIDCLSGMAVAIILGYGGMLVAKGQMTSGDFFSVLTAIIMAFAPLKKIGRAYGQFQETLGVLERVDSFLNKKPEPIRGLPVKGLHHNIRYDLVSFAYPGSDVEVLREIDLNICAGKIFAIVGPSGAGKSTLVDLLPRFYTPLKGKILWDGKNIQELSLKDLRAQMAIVTQDVILFTDTIFENIRAGRPGASRQDVIEAAKKAQAHDFIISLPDGYDTVLDERGLNLSGGQRQRIAIARAILKNPPLLILDEATSALDSVSEQAVQAALEQVMRGRTTIVIAHRLSTIINADKVIVMDHGTIVAQGTHRELLESAELYRELYQTWSSGKEGNPSGSSDKQDH